MKKVKQKHEAPPLGELTDSIHINVDEISDYVRDELAASTLDLIRNILRQPGGREALDARIKAKKQMSDKDISVEQ